MSDNVRHFESVRIIPLPREAVWHVLSHTDRLNRHIGLTPVEFGELASDHSGMFRAATATVGGIKLKWREYPFQWEQDGRYSVVRIYDQGPIERFEGGVELEEAGANSTKVTVFSEMASRGLWGRAIIPLVAKSFIRKTLDFCDKYLSGENPNPAPRGPGPKKGHVNEMLLKRFTSELKRRPVKEEYAEALSRYINTAGDAEVAEIRPFQWAREEGLENDEALRVCLHGVRAGMLNMRWSMMCPNCRVSKQEATTLAGVESRVHCDLCGIEYDLNFDRYVELKFAVHPALRRANSDVYCLSGPFSAPHILAQKRVDPGEIITIPVFDLNQDLRIRVLRANKSVVVSSQAAPLTRLVYDGDGWNASTTRGPFTIENATDTPIYVALEKVEWDQEAVTAAHVTSMQEFRALFSSEVLRPGTQMSIENVTLFFSDLSNSTGLYESIGDGPAYGRVGSHFDFLALLIARNGGAVVKTMGDAVMAVFESPVDATRAALEIQTKFCEFRQSISQDDDFPLDLKIGLHHGPAVVINSNDRLDYFGRTVNIAARVSAAAPGGYFVMTGDMWEFSAVQRLLIEAQAELTRVETPLRGLEQTFALVHVHPNRHPVKFDLAAAT